MCVLSVLDRKSVEGCYPIFQSGVSRQKQLKMITENDLIAACRLVSSKYGEDMGQDVAVILLKWDQRGTLQARDSVSLKKLALHCASLAARHNRRCNFPGKTAYKNYNELSRSDLVSDEMVRTESVADRMELCRLRQLLLAPKNRRVVLHALKLDADRPISRARYCQLLTPFTKAGYIRKKSNKYKASNFKKA